MLRPDAYIIPDTQAKEKVRNPLVPVAHHIADLKPKVVIHLGDHWDFPSLSTYDKGKKSHRARTYVNDVEAGNQQMEDFWAVLLKKWPNYKKECKFVILVGNHEYRRERALEYGPDELAGLMDMLPPDYSGWKVVPFLEVFTYRGVEFSHYFQNPGSARPIGTARQLIMKRHVSSIAGHKQGFDYEEMPMGHKKTIQSMIVGSCYYHDESYMAHCNNHYRGTVTLYDMNQGQFDFQRHSLNFLSKRYKK